LNPSTSRRRARIPSSWMFIGRTRYATDRTDEKATHRTELQRSTNVHRVSISGPSTAVTEGAENGSRGVSACSRVRTREAMSRFFGRSTIAVSKQPGRRSRALSSWQAATERQPRI
jgi:hypothetical protein